MNCNHWNFSLTSFGSSVSRWEIYAVQVGTLDFFNQTQKDVNIVARVNGTQYAKVSAVMVTVNIVQTLDAWMIVVNARRTQKMKIYETICLRDTYGGETTLDDLVKLMQGNKIHRCPK